MKTITVTDEAYSALFSMKGSGESFTRLILRISAKLGQKRKPTLHSLLGCISEEEYQQMKNDHEEFKRNFRFKM